MAAGHHGKNNKLSESKDKEIHKDMSKKLDPCFDDVTNKYVESSCEWCTKRPVIDLNSDDDFPKNQKKLLFTNLETPPSAESIDLISTSSPVNEDQKMDPKKK